MDLRLSLTAPQAEFVTAQEQFPAIVAGFGAGKTEALCARLMVRKLTFPAGWVSYYGPTYDLVNLIAIPRFEELLERHGYSYKLNKSEMILRVWKMGAFVFRTMERPERIVGYECADSGVDELDTLKMAQARSAWVKIIARNRQKKPHGEQNTVAVATTPEGFRFTHHRWVKEGGPRYRLIRATTKSNGHNLPADYIPSLEDSYPPQLLKAYLEGEFVNLTSGSVYPDFDRSLNATTEKLDRIDGRRVIEPVHIGMDFNVYKMAATVNVIRDGFPLQVDELVNLRDTPDMIEAIRTRYGDNGRPITVYPDPAGQSGSSKGASVSDIALLKQAGWRVDYPNAHPAVRDRVAAVNGMILNAKGERRWRINPETCPHTTENIEQQVYDERGAPDKSTGHDHTNDAQGYFLHRKFPIVRRFASVSSLAV